MAKAPNEGLKRILLRAINGNQRLILSHIGESTGRITPTLQELSRRYGIPLSTLKLNAKILKELDLIRYSTISTQGEVELSDLGRFVLNIIEETSITGGNPPISGRQLDLGLPRYRSETIREREPLELPHSWDGEDAECS
jgi:hypothetical protein